MAVPWCSLLWHTSWGRVSARGCAIAAAWGRVNGEAARSCQDRLQAAAAAQSHCWPARELLSRCRPFRVPAVLCALPLSCSSPQKAVPSLPSPPQTRLRRSACHRGPPHLTNELMPLSLGPKELVSHSCDVFICSPPAAGRAPRRVTGLLPASHCRGT